MFEVVVLLAINPIMAPVVVLLNRLVVVVGEVTCIPPSSEDDESTVALGVFRVLRLVGRCDGVRYRVGVEGEPNVDLRSLCCGQKEVYFRLSTPITI
jgi:hypothetical protein